MSNQPAPASTPETIRKKLEELARVSKELEANVKLQAGAANIVAAEQLRKRVTELTETQNTMMIELVNLHPDPESRARFAELTRAIDTFQAEIKACKEMSELRRLESEMEKGVEDYVLCFQTIVAELMGGTPPSEPMFY